MTQSRVHVSDPERAIELWAKEAVNLGSHCHGVIFTATHKEADLYMRITETSAVMPQYERTRSVGGATSYRVTASATLMLRPITCLQDAASVANLCWPFMVFHNPLSWPDRRLIRLLVPRLMAGIHGKSTLVSVGTPMVSVTEDAPPPAPREIDWLAINRAASGQ